MRQFHVLTLRHMLDPIISITNLFTLMSYFSHNFSRFFRSRGFLPYFRRELKTKWRSEVIQYEVKCTGKELMVRAGLEPGTSSSTQARKRFNQLSHDLLSGDGLRENEYFIDVALLRTFFLSNASVCTVSTIFGHSFECHRGQKIATNLDVKIVYDKFKGELTSFTHPITLKPQCLV